MTDTTLRDPTNTTDRAKDEAGEIVHDAKEKAGDVAFVATTQVAGVVDSTRQHLRDRASEEAAGLGERLGAVAEELRAMSRASAQEGGTTAGVVGSIASQIDQGAQRLSEGDLDRAVEDVKRFARNQPGLFLLGAVGAGFAVGRLLRHADLKGLGQVAKEQVGGGDQSIDAPATPGPVSPAAPLSAGFPPGEVPG